MGSATSSGASAQAWEYENPLCGGIVIGVDGSAQSIAALNTAAAIARVKHCSLHAVSVLPPYPSYQINPGSEESRDNVDHLRKTLREGEMADILRALEPGYNWTHEVAVGKPAREIALIAGHRRADLIVVGRRKHSPMDRILGGETTLQIMRTSSIPVLAVESEIHRVRTAVVAVDFSPSSVQAAKVALDLVRSSGTGRLYLVFVEPPAELLANEFMLPAETRFPGDIVVWFRRLTTSLGPHQGILVEPVVLGGRAVSGVIEFADRVGADLIAAGSHSHGRLERFLLGSVSTGIVRNASCPVVVVPPVN